MKLNKHLSQKMIVSTAHQRRLASHLRDALIQALAWSAWAFLIWEAFTIWVQ